MVTPAAKDMVTPTIVKLDHHDKTQHLASPPPSPPQATATASNDKRAAGYKGDRLHVTWDMHDVCIAPFPLLAASRNDRQTHNQTPYTIH
jgi:hypothetical protein